MKQIFALTVLAVFSIGSISLVNAEEGGSGQYIPGAYSSSLNLSPNSPGFVLGSGFIFYNGDFNASRTLPVAGRLVAGLDANVYLTLVSGSYTFGPTILGAHYTFGLALTYLWEDATATVSVGPLRRVIKDTASDISDTIITPVGLNWTFGEVQLNFQSVIYAPTGSYDVGALANAGKNHWMFDQVIGASYTSQKTGTELSGFFGYAVSTENPDTNYRNGNIIHLEGTVQQFLPLGSKTTLLGIGANAFFYKQVTGDSGSGATLGG
ncbi:MAG: SphA family protein, partial [Bryobacteraceae bacterium]